MVFDARIMGLPDYVAFVKSVRGRDGVVSLNAKLEAAQKAMDQVKGLRPGLVAELFRKRGELASHVCLERYGFLTPLRDWASGRCDRTGDGSFEAVFPQLAALGTNDALILPVDFGTPLRVDVTGRVYPYPVLSAQHLFVELDACNRVLRVEKTFSNPKVPDFMKATKSMLSNMEQKEGLDSNFWAKFGLLVLRQLSHKSCETGLPLVFAERLVVPL